MDGIGVDGHVVHDVFEQFVVRFFAFVNAVGLTLEQVDQQRHVPVVFAQLGQYFCGVSFHGDVQYPLSASM